jgi:hypothetical protein
MDEQFIRRLVRSKAGGEQNTSSSSDQAPSLHGESSAERPSRSWSPSPCPIPVAGNLRLQLLRKRDGREVREDARGRRRVGF